MKKLLLASVFAILGVASVHAEDFGGVYVGATAGYSRSDIGPTDAKGFSGGLNAGYGKEFGKLYIGGEIEGGFTGIDAKNGDDGKYKEKDYIGGAARLGYKATDKVMVYGLLGLEGGEFDNGASSDNDWGVRYGVGVEGFVKKNVSLRAGVDYIDWQGSHGLPNANEWRSTIGVDYHF